MKILFGTDNFYPNVNGAAHFSYELAKGLAKSGHEVSVIAPSRKFRFTVTKHQGITIYGISSVMIPKMIHPAGIRIPVTITPQKIKEIIREVNPQIVHIQDHFMIGNVLVNTARKMHIPLVGTNHFMPENFLHYLLPPDFAKKPLSKFAWKQFINVYQHLDIITTPTKTAAGLIKSLGLKNQVLAISCGVDLKRFNPKIKGDYLKKRYQIAPSKPVILFVGRLDKEKKIDVVIKAFSIVLKSINAHLVIVGKGKEKTNLINLTKSLELEKDVTFAGFVPDKELPYLHKMADIFTIASIAELQSIATMEAMASGLPIVAAKVMALPELVHSGKNGYLFNDGDTKDLAKKIVKILENPDLKKRMSEYSLKIIRQHDIKNTIRSYEKLYKRILTSKSRSR
jgi:glycosyltransferase involved in cell wall biosynthesis